MPQFTPPMDDGDVFEHDAEAVPHGRSSSQATPVAQGAGWELPAQLYDDHSGTPEDKERVQRLRGGMSRHEFTAPQPLPRDCVPPEEYWYAGRKVVIYYVGEVPDELLGKCFEILYTGYLGKTTVGYDSKDFEIEILEK